MEDSIIKTAQAVNEDVISDRVNVLTTQPDIGDILCIDEERKYRFIQLDTFHAGTFPAAWETLGVVVMRKGNIVTMCSKHSESKKFMDVYPYVVSGYELDGTEHTAQLRLHGKPSTETYYEFKYTANTDDEFVAQLKEFLSDNGETDWSSYKDAQERVILQYDNYTSIEKLETNRTWAVGLTLTAKVESDIPRMPRMMRRCGNDGDFAWNAARAKEYFREDIESTAYNPSTDVESVPNGPVCWPAFAGTSQYQSDHCLYLRQKYCADPSNPKMEEWERYIDDLSPISPAMIGGLAPKWRGREVFDCIKDITYTAADGTHKPLYPGANYCSKSFDGKGYLPAPYEFHEVFWDVTLGLTGVTSQTADAVNRSLYAIGGDTVRANTSYWICALYSESGIYYAAFSGFSGYGNFYASVTCVPFVDIGLSEISE